MLQTNNHNDSYLLEKIQQGDPHAFELFYKKHWRTVYNHAYKRLKSERQSEDITQEIFTKIWMNRFRLSIKNPSSYLFIAVRNQVLNHIEKQKRVLPVEHLLKEKCASEQADMLLLKKEFIAAYTALIKSLPNKRRNIFIQHYELGKTTAEIAEQLSISRKTVQNQLRRAVTFLKSELTQLLILLIIWLF